MKYMKLFEDIDWKEDWEEEEDVGDNIPCTIYKTSGPPRYLPIFKYKNRDYHLTSIDDEQLTFNNHITINGYELSYIDFTSLMHYIKINNISDNIIKDIKSDKQLLHNDYGNRYNKTFKYSDLKKIFNPIKFY